MWSWLVMIMILTFNFYFYFLHKCLLEWYRTVGVELFQILYVWTIILSSKKTHVEVNNQLSKACCWHAPYYIRCHHRKGNNQSNCQSLFPNHSRNCPLQVVFIIFTSPAFYVHASVSLPLNLHTYRCGGGQCSEGQFRDFDTKSEFWDWSWPRYHDRTHFRPWLTAKISEDWAILDTYWTLRHFIRVMTETEWPHDQTHEGTQDQLQDWPCDQPHDWPHGSLREQLPIKTK